MTPHSMITTTNMISAAKDVFEKNGFSKVTMHTLSGIGASNHCLFEDPYSLVALVVFETWGDIASTWQDIQSAFVELISDHISSTENKVWDCYLLLWTPERTSSSDGETRRQIQYDIGRARKLVATGDDIHEIADIEKALLPLLPLTESVVTASQSSILDRIPEILSTSELPIEKIRAVVRAFEENESLIETLYDCGKPQCD